MTSSSEYSAGPFDCSVGMIQREINCSLDQESTTWSDSRAVLKMARPEDGPEFVDPLSIRKYKNRKKNIQNKF